MYYSKRCWVRKGHYGYIYVPVADAGKGWEGEGGWESGEKVGFSADLDPNCRNFGNIANKISI